MIMMMMMMMTMMTNTIPYRRTKTHIWDKVLMGIWVHPVWILIVIIVKLKVHKNTLYKVRDTARDRQREVVAARLVQTHSMVTVLRVDDDVYIYFIFIYPCITTFLVIF